MMKWLTILFTLFIFFIIVLADTDRLGFLKLINHLPLGDKLGHFVLYGILALLMNLTLLRSSVFQNRPWVVVISTLILAILIGIEEVSQRSLATRTFSLGDLTASYLGVLVFSWLAIKTK